MLKHRALAAASVVGLVGSSFLVATAGPATAAPQTTCKVFFDINKDLHDDIPLGSPLEDTSKANVDSGTVTVAYGDATGQIDPAYDGKSLSETDLGTLSGLGFTSQPHDKFGFSILTADLNGDDCGDLVIGAPGRNAGAGVVYVVYGQPVGTPAFGSIVQVLKQGANGERGASEAGDHFGWSLAVTGSNVNGDPTHLWVGVPDEDIGSTKDAGLVDVYPTTPGALLPKTGITTRVQGSGVGSSPEAGDRFGASLAGSAHTVLVGAPGEDVGSTKDAGMFHAFVDGVGAGYTAETAGVPGGSETGDALGSSVAVWNSCQGGSDAWVIGAPREDIGSTKDAGNAILRDRGTGTWITLQPGLGGVGGTPEASALFAQTLSASGTSTNHTKAVLAIGAPYKNVGSQSNAGQVTMVSTSCPGGVLGVSSATDWTLTSTGLGTATAGDLFGASLGAAKTLAGAPMGGTLDYLLLVGAPNRDEDTVDGPLDAAGMVLSLPATATSFGTAGALLFGQASGNMPGVGQLRDSFGSSLDSANAGR